jgi:hypothetical protein
LLVTFILFYLLSLVALAYVAFSKRSVVCAQAVKIDPKAVCPSKATWTFYKWVLSALIGFLVVKIIVSVALYRAIKRCDDRHIKCYLKVIVFLFVLGTIANLWIQRGGLLCAGIEALVGLVITTLFVCYAWTIASPIIHIRGKHGKDPLEYTVD